MASKEQAREKFVNSVGSALAPKKMAAKLSTYLGIPVPESAGPIANWVKVVKENAAELFDKCYANMQAAYRR